MFVSYGEEIRRENHQFIRRVDAFSLTLLCLMMLSNLFTDYVSMLLPTCLIYAGLLAAEYSILLIAQRCTGRRDLDFGIWYCMSKFFSFAFCSGIFFNQNDVAFTFYIFLVALPLLFLTPGWRMTLFLTAVCVLFALFTFRWKPPEIAKADLYYLWVTWVCTVAISNWVSAVRLNSIHNQRQLIGQRDTDPLTGLCSRLCLNTYLDQPHPGGDYCAFMLDLDHFKDYNDCCGHLAGDRALQRLGASFQHLRDREDLFFARYGGEEFLVLGYCGAERDLEATAQLLLRAVRDCAIPHPTLETGFMTVSVGCARRTLKPGEGFQDLISAADKALYRAKALGGNRVCLAEDVASPSLS